MFNITLYEPSVVSVSPLDEGSFYVCAQNTLYKFSAKGEKLWGYQNSFNHCTTPAIGQDMVFMGSFDKNLIAIHSDDGSLAWKYDTGGVTFAPPVVDKDNNVFIVSSSSYRVFAMKGETGDVLWEFRTNFANRQPPALADGLIAVSSEFALVVLQSNEFKK